MNIKDFREVSVVIPMHYVVESVPVMVHTLIEVDRDGQVNIKIHGAKHANAFIDMIMTQQMTGFAMLQQPAQGGIPGHNVEVLMDPSSDDTPEEEIPVAELCGNHIPLQHRDGKERWCRRCGLTKDYHEPRTIQFGNRPPQIGESFRRYQDGLLNEGP